MTDRTYRTILGFLILVGLYFELDYVIYGLIILLFLEGVTNFRVPILVCMARNCVQKTPQYAYIDMGEVPEPRFSIESERIWRLVVGVFLYAGFILHESLWFFPWFMGFAIFGAGMSGICPVLLAIRWLGFK